LYCSDDNTMETKLTKKHLKELRVVTLQLPNTYYDCLVKCIKSGHEILNDKTFSHLHDNTEDSDKKYTITYLTQYPVNHYLRLKRVYYSGGMNACIEYINSLGDLVDMETVTNLHSRLI
jgi:predicted enzyme involved in methoxymalonyl-ACP biosynthesis